MSLKPSHICDNCGKQVEKGDFEHYEFRKGKQRIVALDFCTDCLTEHPRQVQNSISRHIQSTDIANPKHSTISDEAFANLWNADKSVEEIADVFGITTGYVYHKKHSLSRRGVPLNTRSRGRKTSLVKA